jgi:hypothetical protein
VSSSNCPEPRLTVRREAQAVLVEAEGDLRGTEPGAWQQRRIGYTATYRVEESPGLWCECVCWPEFDDPEERSAFLAVVFHVAEPMTEVFAATADGLICRGVGTQSRRVFQSSEDTLDLERPFFGCLNSETGGFLLLSAPDGESWSSVDHAIIHDSGNGQVAPFLCFRDGYHPTAIVAERRHTVHYTLEAGKGDLLEIVRTAGP